MNIGIKTISTGVNLIGYSLHDVFSFGKHEGFDLEYVIKKDANYIMCVLRDQPGFGLDAEALDEYIGRTKHPYPDDKLPLTETETLPNKKQITIHKSGTKIINFQPILGVNIMKKAILVSHDNKYQSGSEVFYQDGGQEYSYLTDLEDLELDDFVVVDCANGLQVCRVTRLIGLTQSQIHKAHKWIVTRIDMKGHEKNLHAQERIQEIQNKVAERKEQIQGQIILKQMALEDPTMMGLLQELGSLDKNLVPASLLENKPTSVNETES